MEIQSTFTQVEIWEPSLTNRVQGMLVVEGYCSHETSNQFTEGLQKVHWTKPLHTLNCLFF